MYQHRSKCRQVSVLECIKDGLKPKAFIPKLTEEDKGNLCNKNIITNVYLILRDKLNIQL